MPLILQFLQGIVLSFLLVSCEGPPEEPVYEYGGPAIEEIDLIGNPYSNAEEMLQAVNDIYCPAENCEQWIKFREDGIHFAGRTIKWNTPPREQGKGWRTAAEMPPMASTDKPLEGVKIGIDAGHIGGEWAGIDQRDNLIDGKYRIREGNSTLLVAELLAENLRNMGATVLMVRTGYEPVTSLTPEEIASRLAKRDGVAITPELQKEARQLFIRRAEINARAAKLKQFSPDLTLCIHFDAGNTQHPVNRMHLILNGSYTRSEIADEELRLGMISKLLGKVYPEELALSAYVAQSMNAMLKLPAHTYADNLESVGKVPEEPYLWRRNLLANCLYPGPVIYIEPYAMNNVVTARRMVVGDYEGEQIFNKVKYRSIYRDYADSVSSGIRQYYLQNRKKAASQQ